MRYTRKNITLEEKLDILQLADRIGILNACKESGINPTTYYRWRKEFKTGKLKGPKNGEAKK